MSSLFYEILFFIGHPEHKPVGYKKILYVDTHIFGLIPFWKRERLKQSIVDSRKTKETKETGEAGKGEMRKVGGWRLEGKCET